MSNPKDTRPTICYECGVEMTLEPSGFFKCGNCGLDFETLWLMAKFELEELSRRIDEEIRRREGE